MSIIISTSCFHFSKSCEKVSVCALKIFCINIRYLFIKINGFSNHFILTHYQKLIALLGINLFVLALRSEHVIIMEFSHCSILSCLFWMWGALQEFLFNAFFSYCQSKYLHACICFHFVCMYVCAVLNYLLCRNRSIGQMSSWSEFLEVFHLIFWEIKNTFVLQADHNFLNSRTQFV